HGLAWRDGPGLESLEISLAFRRIEEHVSGVGDLGEQPRSLFGVLPGLEIPHVGALPNRRGIDHPGVRFVFTDSQKLKMGRWTLPRRDSQPFVIRVEHTSAPD